MVGWWILERKNDGSLTLLETKAPPETQIATPKVNCRHTVREDQHGALTALMVTPNIHWNSFRVVAKNYEPFLSVSPHMPWDFHFTGLWSRLSANKTYLGIVAKRGLRRASLCVTRPRYILQDAHVGYHKYDEA